MRRVVMPGSGMLLVMPAALPTAGGRIKLAAAHADRRDVDAERQLLAGSRE